MFVGSSSVLCVITFRRVTWPFVAYFNRLCYKDPISINAQYYLYIFIVFVSPVGFHPLVPSPGAIHYLIAIIFDLCFVTHIYTVTCKHESCNRMRYTVRWVISCCPISKPSEFLTANYLNRVTAVLQDMTYQAADSEDSVHRFCSFFLRIMGKMYLLSLRPSECTCNHVNQWTDFDKTLKLLSKYHFGPL